MSLRFEQSLLFPPTPFDGFSLDLSLPSLLCQLQHLSLISFSLLFIRHVLWA